LSRAIYAPKSPRFSCAFLFFCNWQRHAGFQLPFAAHAHIAHRLAETVALFFPLAGAQAPNAACRAFFEDLAWKNRANSASGWRMPLTPRQRRLAPRPHKSSPRLYLASGAALWRAQALPPPFCRGGAMLDSSPFSPPCAHRPSARRDGSACLSPCDGPKLPTPPATHFSKA
jgi:hypothetical protein